MRRELRPSYDEKGQYIVALPPATPCVLCARPMFAMHSRWQGVCGLCAQGISK